MNSEYKILRILYTKGLSKINVRAAAREAGFGIDYTRYMLGQLAKRGMVISFQGKDFFKISAKGKKEFELPHSEKGGGEAKSKKRQIIKRRKHKGAAITQPLVILAHNLNSKGDERKANLWSAIKKAAKYLSAIPPEKN